MSWTSILNAFRKHRTDGETSEEDALDYAQELYKNVLEWRKDAETKAQLVLTLDGVFLSFLTATILAKRADLEEIVGSFGFLSWIFLTLMALSLFISLSCAVGCLTSAPLSKREVQEIFRRNRVNPQDASTFSPHVMWYFQTISKLPEDNFVRRGESIGKSFVRETLARQAHVLSGRVLRKYQFVQWAFSSTGLALGLFLALGIAHILEVQGIL